MVEEGCLEGVDEVYGIHNVPNHDLGVLVCPDRGIMASCDVLEITISGQGGHGALPHNNNDVILTTACLI